MVHLKITCYIPYSSQRGCVLGVAGQDIQKTILESVDTPINPIILCRSVPFSDYRQETCLPFGDEWTQYAGMISSSGLSDSAKPLFRGKGFPPFPLCRGRHTPFFPTPGSTGRKSAPFQTDERTVFPEFAIRLPAYQSTVSKNAI